MTVVPSLLTWDFVGYCATADGETARMLASNPNPRQSLASEIVSLCVLDMLNSSFQFFRRATGLKLTVKIVNKTSGPRLPRQKNLWTNSVCVGPTFKWASA